MKVKKNKICATVCGENISKFTEDLIWTLYNNHTRDNVYADILKKKRFFSLEKIDIYWSILHRAAVLTIKPSRLCHISHLTDFSLEKN